MLRLCFQLFCLLLTTFLFWLALSHALRLLMLDAPSHPWRKLLRLDQLRRIAVFTSLELVGLFLLTGLFFVPVRALRPPPRAPGRRPVILIPGAGLHRGDVRPLAHWLRRRGHYTLVCPLGPRAGLISSASRSVEELAGRLNVTVKAALAATGATQVTLIGFGAGGLVARHFAELEGHGDQVHSLISVGTAHAGTRLAWLAEGLLSALRRENPLMQALETSLVKVPPGRYLAIRAQTDACVLPSHSAGLEAPQQQVIIEDLGHHFLPFSAQVWHLIAAQLASQPAVEEEARTGNRTTDGSRALPAPREALPGPATPASSDQDPGDSPGPSLGET